MCGEGWVGVWLHSNVFMFFIDDNGFFKPFLSSPKTALQESAGIQRAWARGRWELRPHVLNPFAPRITPRCSFIWVYLKHAHESYWQGLNNKTLHCTKEYGYTVRMHLPFFSLWKLEFKVDPSSPESSIHNEWLVNLMYATVESCSACSRPCLRLVWDRNEAIFMTDFCTCRSSDTSEPPPSPHPRISQHCF